MKHVRRKPETGIKKDYRNPALPIQKRVKDLLSRMTIKEKVDQLSACFCFNTFIDWETYTKMSLQERIEFNKSIKASDLLRKTHWGQLCIILRDLPPRVAAEKANEIQKAYIEKTRLGIPVIIHDEGLHGLHCNGATSFPQSIAMASSWEPSLMEEVASAIGKEARSRGVSQLLSPTINIARDTRCGRTEETYGEDPYLTARMGVAFVRGVQSWKVATTPKHYVANFVGDGGRDSNAIFFSEQILRQVYFPAFKACVEEAGALSIMSAYNSLNGTPCTCNKWLLMDVLRGEWNFQGFVVSDYGSVRHIRELHKVAETDVEAGIKAIEAGLDIELPSNECFGKEFLEAVRRGKVSKKALDRAVAALLKVKFMLGLFENPFADPDEAENVSNCEKHRRLALEAARRAMVLLDNKKRTLPLSKKIKAVAVIGPNADEIRLGGYSWGNYTKREIVTPLKGIQTKLEGRAKVHFARGCGINDTSTRGFKHAVKAARKSDVALLCMGNSSETEGEARDRAHLDLPGVQEDLILAIAKTGVPVVVVLINGSAVTMERWGDSVAAIVEAWYPGEEGGTAIADVLFGDYNPGGKLPVSFPRSSAQLPLYYNPAPTGRGYDYVDLPGQPRFPFGHGLSYTWFEYGNLKISPRKISPKGKVTIRCNVSNRGRYTGDEVVQLYIHDALASIARPLKELKGFKRIRLKPRGTMHIEFTLEAKDLGYYDDAMNYIVEPGTFEVMIGSSSEDIRLEGSFDVRR